MNKKSIIKLIYLYLFSLVGLVLIIIGSVQLIDLGLKSYVLTEAEMDRYTSAPPSPERFLNEQETEAIKEGESIETIELTEQQQALFQNWQKDYKRWQERDNAKTRLRSDRQQRAANALAMLIVGVPLYTYHWRKTLREKDNS